MRNTATTGLLVVGKGKVDGSGKPCRHEGWHGCQRGRQKPFHVGGSSAVKVFAVDLRTKGSLCHPASAAGTTSMWPDRI